MELLPGAPRPRAERPQAARPPAPRPLARCDEELKTHLINTARCVAADGAAKERRAVFLATRELFPNALIVIRDSAHAIRIASKALHLDELFSKVWKCSINATRSFQT